MTEVPKPEQMNGGEVVYRASNPSEMQFRDEDGSPVIEGRMMPYEEWTEVRSKIEGHFMEKFAPGALAKTISEQADRVRALFEHGFDAQIGKQPIAAIDEMRDEDDGAHYRASLLEGLPSLIVSGLKRGLYGSSIRFSPVKWDRVRSPKASMSNPDGIEERVIREASMREFSIVAFPQYAGATARIRSITEEIEIGRYRDDPQHLIEVIQHVMTRHDVEPEPDKDTTPLIVGETEPEPIVATTREPGVAAHQSRRKSREEWSKWITTI